ncbi:MAG: zinc ribbon domain-containing protein [Candidatus Helarchaeota archaeon]
MTVQKFNCYKCGQRIAVIKALIKGYIVVVAGKCPNRHGVKLYLQFKKMDRWIDDMKISVYQCICGNELQLEQVLPRGAYVILRMRCPVHGVVKKYVALPIWNEMESLIPITKKFESEKPTEEYISREVYQEEIATTKNRDWETNIVDNTEELQDRIRDIKYCPYCGEEVTPGSFFCTNCGAELN